MREQANELAEAHLEVDRNMVCAMRDLTHTMGCANMGILSVAGVGAPGVSVGVGSSGEHEEDTSCYNLHKREWERDAAEPHWG